MNDARTNPRETLCWYGLPVLLTLAVFALTSTGCTSNSLILLTDDEYAEFRDIEDFEETLRAPPDPDAPAIVVASPQVDTLPTPFDIDI